MQWGLGKEKMGSENKTKRKKNLQKWTLSPLKNCTRDAHTKIPLAGGNTHKKVQIRGHLKKGSLRVYDTC